MDIEQAKALLAFQVTRTKNYAQRLRDAGHYDAGVDLISAATAAEMRLHRATTFAEVQEAITYVADALKKARSAQLIPDE